jgi:hypothetical protein
VPAYAHALRYGDVMARYVTTIPSSLSPQEAFAYMADLHNFAKWDKGVVKVVQVEGSGAGLGTIFDVTVKGVGKSTSTLRYTTTEYDEFSNILVRGVNTFFTSVDRVTIIKTTTGCAVIYDATLTANWIIAGMNLILGKVFNKIGDTATSGLRKVLA